MPNTLWHGSPSEGFCAERKRAAKQGPSHFTETYYAFWRGANAGKQSRRIQRNELRVIDWISAYDHGATTGPKKKETKAMHVETNLECASDRHETQTSLHHFVKHHPLIRPPIQQRAPRDCSRDSPHYSHLSYSKHSQTQHATSPNSKSYADVHWRNPAIGRNVSPAETVPHQPQKSSTLTHAQTSWICGIPRPQLHPL